MHMKKKMREIRVSADMINQLTRELEGDYKLTKKMKNISEKIRAHALWIMSSTNWRLSDGR